MKRFRLYTEADSARRLEIESDPFTLTSNSYVTISLPKDEDLNMTAIISRTILDRFPERAVCVKNTGSNNILFQVEWSIEENPNNGTSIHWFCPPDKTNIEVPAGGMVLESSSKVPYTAMRIRVKPKTDDAFSTVTVIISFGKWKG